MSTAERDEQDRPRAVTPSLLAEHRSVPALSILAMAIGTLAGSLLPGCADKRVWTAYSKPGPSESVANGQAFPLGVMPESLRLELNAGCMGCHEGAGDPHESTEMGCTDCHGGNGRELDDKDRAHPRPRYPDRWPEGGGNPERSYALLNEERLEWIRFVNPGDLRVAPKTCGTADCHPEDVLHVSKSLMTNSAHFYGAAAYANGILPNKSTILGESYSPEGVPQAVFTVPAPSQAELERSVIPAIFPLPQWEVTQTGNIFRTFEKGSRLGGAALGFNGNPVPLVGLPDKLEDPGRPNNRLSDRGLGTLNRIDLPLLNVFKTRLNDPHLSFMGTNDQPGDFRHSGCTACHMVYANDRSPVHSGPYATYGNQGRGNVSVDPWGQPVAADPTISQDDPGHPLMHRFTRAIPSSQCMTCHHHQPNSFVNSYFGFTMWNYETDGIPMWPEEQAYPNDSEIHERMLRNPEGAAGRGLWGERGFLDRVAELNPQLEHTQFADYHGHGWIYRAAFKMDREGNLLDPSGGAIPYGEAKFEGVSPKLGSTPTGPEIQAGAFEAPEGKAVHLMDIHAERGMHCVDCHFEQDVHGDGKLYAEYQAAVEIKCEDCHGTIGEDSISAARLITSGPAASGTTNLQSRRSETPWKKLRFERRDDEIVQRSMLYPDLEWKVPQISATDTLAHKLLDSEGGLAHDGKKMECYTCHTSWVTSCFGCHLPQEANWKTPMRHFGKKELRNFATYNPQVVRDSEFMLGIAGDVKGNKVAPVRSSSALVISSQDAVRQKIYAQVPTIAANGMSSQVFNTHFPHTVRTTETRACDDCHLSPENDNNAWLASTYLLGTNYVNLMGYRAFVGEGKKGFSAVRVTEWDEPQAVLGSRLHEIAYPDDFAKHVAGGRKLKDSVHHGGTDIRSLQLRGEYLYTASGRGGFRVYDVANVNNKGFSEKVVTAPVSPIGQDTHVRTEFATAVALPTNNHISLSRAWRPENREVGYEYDGRKQNMHESYRYAYVSDRREGLIVVDVDCLSDFDPQNNFVRRAATFNPDGVLNGAENLVVCGTTVYVCCDVGVVAVDIDDPLDPRVLSKVTAPAVERPSSIHVQFRYAFVTDKHGVQVLDVTHPARMHAVEGARVPLEIAHDVYLGRHYAYVSAGPQGLVILDVRRPEQPRIDQAYTAEGRIGDLRQTRLGMTNDSLFAYLADGANGMHVVKLVGPEDGGRSAYGFSPQPVPEWVSTYRTDGPALAISEGLDRDRAVDEAGNQVAAFSRIGGRPLNLKEQQRLYLTPDGVPYRPSDESRFDQPQSGVPAGREPHTASPPAEVRTEKRDRAGRR